MHACCLCTEYGKIGVLLLKMFWPMDKRRVSYMKSTFLFPEEMRKYIND